MNDFLKTQALGAVGSVVNALLSIQPSRSFASFTDFVSITESHTASVMATDYPIELGAPGTDHVIKQPAVLTWEIAFSEQSSPIQTFKRLHDLMISAVPFDAITGVKSYSNMLIIGMSTTTDNHTGRILKVILNMREVIITQAQKTTLPPKEKQKAPQETAGTEKTGKKQTAEADTKQKEQHNSFLKRVFE